MALRDYTSRASSRYRQNAFASRICCGVRQSGSNSARAADENAERLRARRRDVQAIRAVEKVHAARRVLGRRRRQRHDDDRRLLTLKLVDGADAHVRQPFRERRDLGVVRRDDHEVRVRERRFLVVGVTVADAVGRQRRDERRDGLDLFARARLVGVVLDGYVHEARAAEGRGGRARGCQHGLPLELGRRRQPILVEGLGREPANVGV